MFYHSNREETNTDQVQSMGVAAKGTNEKGLEVMRYFIAKALPHC